MFAVECNFLNLDQIYKSGQVFRWFKFGEGKYLIPYKDKLLKAEQHKSKIILSCDEQSFYDFWYNFFDMGTPYDELNYALRENSEYLKRCAVRGKGVRIVKQELFEVIISFIMSQQQNIPTIRAKLDKVCKLLGKKRKQSMGDAGQVTWYEFPEPGDFLLNAELLSDCGLGYREPYILGVCEAIVDGWLDLQLLQKMPYEEAKAYLMSFTGIGPKVADCICLYGLHHMQAFPVDTHIQQIMEREFELDDPVEAREWYYPNLDGFEGYVQQLMFYSEIVKEEVEAKYGVSG